MIFQFLDFNFDSNSYLFEMYYTYSEIDHVFKEVLDFSAYKDFAFDFNKHFEAFKILFLVSGISYYKIFASGEIELGKFKVNQEQAEFLNFFYKNGLSEFIYKNQLDFESNIPDFTKYACSYEINNLGNLKLHDLNLLAWGGGKDSIVSSLLLDFLGEKYDLFCVKSDRIKESTAKINGSDFFEVKRVLDSKINEFNSRKDSYNGHVPITGILAFIKVIVSLMKGYKNIILSNEFSADEANLEYKGQKINHQFSKGIEFEQKINSYIHKFIHPNLNYFSLLRPFYELKIAEIFSNHAEKYFPEFSSCNRNFHFDESKNIKGVNFCCECEKCAFVYLILSPFLDKSKLINIFGKNLFEVEALRSVYFELCGLSEKKPFECVGTFDECRLAFLNLSLNADWKDELLVKDIVKLFEPTLNVDLMSLQEDYSFNENWYLRIKNEFA